MSADEEISKEFLDRITQLAERIEDVDIIKRHQTVLDSLNTLRIGKKKLIRQLQLLLDNDSDVQLTNDLINKIIQSFNELRKQEQEFTLSMKEVVLKFCGDLDELLPKLSDIQKVLKTDEENNYAELKVLEVNRLTLKLQNIQQMIFGFNSMFKEAEIASNYLDQQLTTRLSIYFEKKKQKTLVQQLREKSENSNSSSNDKIAHHHIKFINSNTNCNSNSERRQRQLERLRREAAKRGLNKVEEDNETCNISLLTTKVSADLVNNEKEDEKILAEDERIPPIPQLPEKEMCTSNLDKKKDDLPSKISERFSSLAARKHKMRLIQSKLSNLQQQKMENTYDEAVNRYKFLSEMRKKLEGLQISASTSAEASDQVSDDTKDDVNQLDGPKDEQKNTPNDDLDNEVNVKDNLTSDC